MGPSRAWWNGRLQIAGRQAPIPAFPQRGKEKGIACYVAAVALEVRNQEREQPVHHTGRQIMAHALNAFKARTGYAPGRVLAAGHGDQRVCAAVHHQRGRLYLGQRRGARAVGGNGHHLAHKALRVKAALCRGHHFLAQLRLGRWKAGAAYSLEQLDGVVHGRLHALAGGPAQQHAGDGRAGFRQAARAAGTHDAGKAQQPRRRKHRQALRDHAAHADAHHVRFGNLQCIEHTQRIGRHVLQAVGRAYAPAQAEFQALPEQVGRAKVVEVLGQADVAVVQAHNPKARIGNRLHHGRRPGDQLHAQAHDEQHHGPACGVTGVGVFDFDVDVVGFDFHN